MRALLSSLLLLAILASPAWAERVAVVVDRGSGAAEQGEELAATAATLVQALRDRDVEAKLYVYGARPNGRIRAAELRGNPAQALETASEREGWKFEGGTDPRHALHATVRRGRPEEPLLVVLVGPFTGDVEGGAEALSTWDVRAPVGSRVFAVGLDPERVPLVAEAQGWVGDGVLVLGAGEVQADPAPFSPLSDDPLVAELQVPLQTIEFGAGTTALSASSEGDQIALRRSDTGLKVTLTRNERTKRTATVSFEAAKSPAVLWFADVPPPRTFRWDQLAPDAKLEGAAPLLVVKNGEVGRTVTQAWQILRSRIDPTPTWTVSGDLPEGLEVEIGPEASRDETTVFREVRVSFRPEAGKPVNEEGTIVLEAKPYRFEIPYRIAVPPGRVTVTLEAPDEPTPLPAGEGHWTIRASAENANAPAEIRVKAIVIPSDAAQDIVATLESPGGLGGVWDLSQSAPVPVGGESRLRLDLAPGSLGVEAEIAIEWIPQPGVEGTASGAGRVTRRNPRLVISDEAWAYRVEDKRVVGDPPLIIRLDPDGGGGRWVVDITTTPPQVEGDFELVRRAWDRWVLRPKGPWMGGKGDTFSSRSHAAPVRFTWTNGAVPDPLTIEIEVPPRWGSAGWILVVLAGLALLLAGWGALQLRPAALEGTLLYTVEGRSGAVGRLDLGSAGRRPRTLTADRGGRLALGGKGDAIAMLKPTRVGGMLVVIEGDAAEEHLLVDGLTLQVGRHGIRYVSGRPDDAAPPPAPTPDEQLLGPEFELGSGRIDALGKSGESDDPVGRS